MKKLREFIDEGLKLKLGKVNEVEFEHRPTRTTAKLVGGDTSMYLTGVHTPQEHRGRGGAHEVMKMVTGYLDALNRRGSLKAKPQESSVNVGRLEKLYREHGFVKGADGMMTREPAKRTVIGLGKKTRTVDIGEATKRIDSTHYIHPSGLHLVQKSDRTWSVYDTFDDDSGDLRNELSVKHSTKRSAASSASMIYRQKKRNGR